MAKITYADKVSINIDANIPEINKTKDTNINEIKEVVNNNDEEFLSGWIPITETLTYVSVDNPSAIINFSGDVTAKYQIADKLKLTNNSNVSYAKIVYVGTYDNINNVTPITIIQSINYPNNDAYYALANSAITNVYFSRIYNPLEFPVAKNNWTLISKSNSNLSKTTPTSNIWYNLGDFNLPVKVGDWTIAYDVNAEGSTTSGNQANCYSTLSTSVNSETDIDFTSFSRNTAPATGSVTISEKQSKYKIMRINSPTTFYLNAKTLVTGQNSVSFRGDQGTTIIKAILDY